MPMKPLSMETREDSADWQPLERLSRHRHPSPIGELHQSRHNASAGHSLTIARVLG